MLLPGWDDLQLVKHTSSTISVTTLCCWGVLVVSEIVAHSWKARKTTFDVVALVAFALAVCGEAVTYKYNQRKDELYEAREDKVKDSADKEIQKTRDEAEAARRRADCIQAQLDALNRRREVTTAQRSFLLPKLSPFKGTTVTMIYMLAGGDETQHYAEQIAGLLREAGWQVGVNPGTHSGVVRHDLTVAVNDQKHPHAATLLLDGLKAAGFLDVEGEANAGLSTDSIQLIVRPMRPAQLLPCK